MNGTITLKKQILKIFIYLKQLGFIHLLRLMKKRTPLQTTQTTNLSFESLFFSISVL
jgi:hypothetical protein